eukprot:TRINITY_DN6241_c0_g1_i5.p1 TRINITY_DN6241_c0_g1~~TRINITY_DN6241_c0_g1_i5.p1  ORF type:complete len:118 (+),score=27.69 TRINITY_DN6241_c0_g1_i5:29-382(+)
MCSSSATSFFYYLFFLMIRRPPRSTLSSSSAASDVYKRQYQRRVRGQPHTTHEAPSPPHGSMPPPGRRVPSKRLQRRLPAKVYVQWVELWEQRGKLLHGERFNAAMPRRNDGWVVLS